jgi:hypothetical protein
MLPAVVMDEAGHSGENLLDRAQPVYALAALQIDPDVAEAAVNRALSRAQKTTIELKFSSLRRSSPGRRNLLQFLDELSLHSVESAIVVVDKSWTVAAKLIDELVEPRMLAKGLQPVWYASGAAKNMVHALYEGARAALGETYAGLARAFQIMVRDYTSETAASFLSALERAKIACLDPEIYDLLSMMIDQPEQLEAEFAARAHALDPALPSLFWQGGYWSRELQTRFVILHDNSSEVRRWQEEIFSEIQQAMADRTTPEAIELGEIVIELPTLLDNIAFEVSHDDPRLQVADVLAGGAAHLYAVNSGLRGDEGNLARDLARAGVGGMVKHFLGPE